MYTLAERGHEGLFSAREPTVEVMPLRIIHPNAVVAGRCCTMTPVPSLPMYLHGDDVALLVDHLDDDADIAWLAPGGPGRWIAVPRHPALRRRIGLWHVPSGPLPLLAANPIDSSTEPITDPWSGWQERRAGRNPDTPYFGARHPGVYWLNLRTGPGRSGEIGLSSFEWIGNHYRPIGSAADPSTERHWKTLRRWVAKMAVKIPRSGGLAGTGAEIFAFPHALAAISNGTTRDPNPF